MAVTLINVFTVPRGKEAEFVDWWKRVKENITRQPGFISGKLHKSLKPTADTISSTSRYGTMKRFTGRFMRRVWNR